MPGSRAAGVLRAHMKCAFSCHTIRGAVAERSYGQFGSARYIQFTKDVIDIFLHSAFAQVQIVRDLLIGFGLGNERNNLSFAEGEGVTWLGNGPALGCAACRTSVLFSAGMKTIPASSTTPRHECASGGHCNINLFHNYEVPKPAGILLLFPRLMRGWIDLP
jgi:hypothetical protein